MIDDAIGMNSNVVQILFSGERIEMQEYFQEVVNVSLLMCNNQSFKSPVIFYC